MVTTKLWDPLVSFKDQEQLHHLGKNGRKPLIKETGFAEKALWDWLMLMGVLAIPVAVAFGTFLFSQQQTLTSQAVSERQHETDLKIATDQQRENDLQIYFDRMTALLLAHKLDESKPGQEIQAVARAQTLIVLPRLDAVRKRLVLQFLYEANLITRDNSVVNLRGADLRGANLKGENLFAADLSEADLSEADLTGATLTGATLRFADLSGATLGGATLQGADLSGANLTHADLRFADLSEADLNVVQLNFADLAGTTITREQLAQVLLLHGATMPDGSRHP